jgi:hypothetical protein
MLDDIAIRPLLEEPAGEGAVPLIVAAFAHVELHEGAGLGHFFPGRRHFAGAQANDGIIDAKRLAGLHAELAGDAVALVEQADDGDALGHRRAGQADHAAGRHGIARDFLWISVPGAIGRGLFGPAGSKGGEGSERQQPPARRSAPAESHASGVQAS